MSEFERKCWSVLVVWSCLAFGSGCSGDKPSGQPASSQGGGTATAGASSEDGTVRNPFGVKLEPIPVDDEVRAFAKLVNLPGDGADANAADWGEFASGGTKDSLDGEWTGRWRYSVEGAPWVPQTEPTKVQTVGDRTYFLFTYHEGGYIMVMEKEGDDRLIGRFMSVRDPRDTGMIVCRVVSPERIDGEWKGPAGAGRWDYRRRLE